MLSGIPDIDVDDWMKNTSYQAGFTENDETIQAWFTTELIYQKWKIRHFNSIFCYEFLELLECRKRVHTRGTSPVVTVCYGNVSRIDRRPEVRYNTAALLYTHVILITSNQLHADNIYLFIHRSRVPWGGFSNLSGATGSQLFTICRVDGKTNLLPTTSTWYAYLLRFTVFSLSTFEVSVSLFLK